MFKKKHYLYLDESEYNVLVRSLVELKNRLIRAERFTDCVDELIMGFSSLTIRMTPDKIRITSLSIGSISRIISIRHREKGPCCWEGLP